MNRFYYYNQSIICFYKYCVEKCLQFYFCVWVLFVLKISLYSCNCKLMKSQIYTLKNYHFKLLPEKCFCKSKFLKNSLVNFVIKIRWLCHVTAIFERLISSGGPYLTQYQERFLLYLCNYNLMKSQMNAVKIYHLKLFT